MPVPDAEGASRCERAFRIVNHIAKRAGDWHDDVSIVLGAGREIVQMRQRDRAGTTHVRIATSWWHAPRTWIVALSVFHKLIRVSCARTTIPSATLAREMFKEACKIPYELLRTIPAFDRLTQNWYDPQYQ